MENQDSPPNLKAGASLATLKIISKAFQFLLGFILALILLAGLSAGIAYYFLSKLAGNPPKPIETNPVLVSPSPEEPAVKTAPLVTAQAGPAPEVAVSPSPEPELPEGSYRATVTWPQGLTTRSGPSTTAERIGGVQYNDVLIILETSPDEIWQKVRVEQNGQEGWVKAGNVQKID